MLDSSAPAATLQPPATTERRPATGRPFNPGCSGNPSGKAKAAPDPGALARRHTTACIRALASALTGSDPAAAVCAARTLLEHGYGQPIQHIAASLPNLTMLLRAATDEETARANGEARTWDA